MKKVKSTLYADEGCVLRRKADGTVFGESITLGYTYQIGGHVLDTPHKENEDDYEDVFEVEMNGTNVMIVKGGYGDIVDQLIRLRYSQSQEFAILRQRDEKPDEFSEYNEYCELCKEKARGVSSHP